MGWGRWSAPVLLLGVLTLAGAEDPRPEAPAPGTIEDIYGDTGNFFKAAIAIRTDEKDSPDEPDPAVGYGLGVDDVLLMWREYSTVADIWNCGATGACAVIDVQTNNFYEARAVVAISLLESSPEPANDCDLDGSIEPGEDQDCDNDGITDLVARATSAAEPAGEIVVLDRISSTVEYRGEIPISGSVDAAGILLLSAAGTQNPTVTVVYRDANDGTGQPCRNNVDPAQWGVISATTEVFATPGSITIGDAFGFEMTDNGDGDGFPDTNETISLTIRVRNLGSTVLHNVQARLTSDSPHIDCILDGAAFVGDVAPAQIGTAADPFVLKVGAIDRTALGLNATDPLSAEMKFTLTSDEFDVASVPQTVTLELDLDFTGGSGPTTYFESFEVPFGLGSFTTMNIDAGRHNLQASNGYRCQYQNPDDPQANSFGDTTCYLGGTFASADRFHWQIDDPFDIDLGRAYTGTNSLYMGIFGAAANMHTTPMGTLEAVASASPINLGVSGLAPELSFKHQISLLDSQNVSGNPGQTADRGVVHAQLANGSGAGIGDWIKLEPYSNVYDEQAQDNFFNCTFDPVDDGNDEDDVTSRPPQSIRPYGPSSTCLPEFVFAHLGDTFLPFNPSRIGNAEGPGLRGSSGLGTWVDSRISLFRFRGRRIRLRFLTAGLKSQGVESWEQIFVFNPNPGDDGWWIDDVTVTNVLTTPAVVSNDNKQLALPSCGAICNTVQAVLVSSPSALPAPGQVLTVSALGSTADRCLDGALLFRFCISADDDCKDQGDAIVRSFTDNPSILVAPSATTHYAVDVRCSSAPTCQSSAGLTVQVLCPGAIQAIPTVRAPSKLALSWGQALPFDVARGVLDADRVELQTYTENLYLANQPAATSYSIAADSPAPNTGFWYLFRPPGPLGSGSGLCNDPQRSWGQPSRDAGLP